MKRTKSFCYRNYMGDFLSVINKLLPADVSKNVYSLWLIHSVEDMLKFDDFQLFRAKYNGVLCTFQQYVDGTWCCKINY